MQIRAWLLPSRFPPHHTLGHRADVPTSITGLTLSTGTGVSRNTAPAQNIGVTAINKAELTCCDVRTGT